MKKIGVLITNTGTPDAPTTSAVRRYLREFLSDPRIVHINKFIWLPILYGLILPLRSQKSAALYQRIWRQDGSPLRAISLTLVSKLNKELGASYHLECGMNYGSPSIEKALARLADFSPDEIIFLPLFPQYSDTTTASSNDRLEKARSIYPIKKIRDYADHPDYIEALASTVQAHWQKQGQRAHLLISFHGIPERFVKEGDPYASRCEITANLLARALQLKERDWTLCYQSQFGYDKWLKPSTQALFTELPKAGVKHIDIICPGFPIDCLETLEEIAIAGKKQFLSEGGEQFNFIPSLNDSPEHIHFLKKFIQSAVIPAPTTL